MSAAEMRNRAHKFLSSRYNLSILAKILQTFEMESDNYCPTLLATELIFSELLKRGDLQREVRPLKPTVTGSREVEALRELYALAWRHVLACMTRGAPASRVQALASAIRLLQQQGRTPMEAAPSTHYYFPVPMLQALMSELLSNEVDMSALIRNFAEVVAHDDVLLHSWRSLIVLTPSTSPCEVFIKNYIAVIDILRLRTPGVTPAPQLRLLCDVEGKSAFHFPLGRVTRCVSRAWTALSSWPLSAESHRRALLLLLDRLLPHLPNPLLLTDFLMDSMDTGGAVSMLALQGVFTLLQKHNLDYPRVYSKLYSMFEPEIFHTKHKARLYYLTDMFLSSTHLPEALVAGFVKRLCRLALLGPPPDATLLLHLAANLLVRHPALKRLACREEPPLRKLAYNDPYVMDEGDPERSMAMESSLWEAAGLRHHVLPGVREAATRVLAAPHAPTELPLATLLDDTPEDLFDREFSQTCRQVFLTFNRPQSLRLPTGECIAQYWHLV